MRYHQPLTEGKLIRRYQRFLADILIGGEVMTVLCPNTGSMAGLLDEGNPVRISGPHSGKRKYPFTLEQIRVARPDGRKIWVGVNTAVPEIIAREAAETGSLPGFEAYNQVKTQVSPAPGSRIDLLLTADKLPPCWIEVKNVTLVLPDPSVKARFNQGNVAAFPDAVTARGLKHLRCLKDIVCAGQRAVMLYVIQRSDGDSFAPAQAFDRDYTEEFRRAEEAGVEIFPMKARVEKRGIYLRGIMERMLS